MENRWILVVVLFAFVFAKTEAQNNYAVTGTVYIIDGNPQGTSLEVITATEKEQKVSIDAHGHFYVFLNWDKQYKFRFSREGYVSKCVNFSTLLPDDVDKESLYPYDLMVELFPVFPNVDSVFYKKPVALISYNKTIRDFDYNLDYHLAVKKHVDKTMSDYLVWKKQRVRTNAAQNDNSISNIIPDVTNIDPQVMSTKESDQQLLTTSSKITDKQYGLPPLETNYPEGKTVEYFSLQNKDVMRVIIKQRNNMRAFYQVKHRWGGVYYFMETQPSMYTSISEYSFYKSVDDK